MTCNSYKYFANKDCKYYPCHEGIEELNCLFCYCPLYNLENCPGNHIYIEKNGHRIKNCINCIFPHKEDNYEKVIKVLKSNL